MATRQQLIAHASKLDTLRRSAQAALNTAQQVYDDFAAESTMFAALADAHADPVIEAPAPIPPVVQPPIVEPPEPEPGAAEMHEPSGMTRVHVNDWSKLGGLYRNIEIVADRDAPASGPMVGQMTYRRGHPSGSGPGLFELSLGNRYRTLYVAQTIRYGEEYFGDDSGVNKMSYVYGRGWKPYFYTLARGQGNGALTHAIATQHFAGSVAPWLMPNRGAAEVVRGKWQRYEYLFALNSAGKSDGSVRAWTDGVLTHEYDGMRMSTDASTWEAYQWNPVFGGNGGRAMPVQTTQRMDHLYVSGK